MGHRFLIVLVAVAAIGTSASAAGCRLEDYDPSVRPKAGPTDVAVGFYIVDVADVHDVEQSFRVDFFAWLEWSDPRLGAAVARSGRDACKFPLEDVWNPEIDVLNRRDLRPHLAALVRVRPDGQVRHVQRFEGDLRTSLDLRRFPLDRQILPVTLFSSEYGPDEVQLTSAPGSFRASGDLSLEGWRLEKESHRVGTLDNQLANPGAEIETFARMDYELHVARSPGYYVWRAIVPCRAMPAVVLRRAAQVRERSVFPIESPSFRT